VWPPEPRTIRRCAGSHEGLRRGGRGRWVGRMRRRRIEAVMRRMVVVRKRVRRSFIMGRMRERELRMVGFLKGN
jgi:hypothetical protein